MSTLISIPDLLIPSGPDHAAAETELRSVRMQAALVRSLLDELEHIAPSAERTEDADAIADQTVEELVHLGCKMIEAAAAIAPQRFAEICTRRGRTSR